MKTKHTQHETSKSTTKMKETTKEKRQTSDNDLVKSVYYGEKKENRINIQLALHQLGGNVP